MSHFPKKKLNINQQFIAYETLAGNGQLLEIRKLRQSLIEKLFMRMSVSKASSNLSVFEAEVYTAFQKSTELFYKKWNRKRLIIHHEGGHPIFLLPPESLIDLELPFISRALSWILFFFYIYAHATFAIGKFLASRFRLLFEKSTFVSGVVIVNPLNWGDSKNYKADEKNYTFPSWLKNNLDIDNAPIFAISREFTSSSSHLQYLNTYLPKISPFERRKLFVLLSKQLARLLIAAIKLDWKKLIISKDLMENSVFEASNSLHQRYIFQYQGSMHRPLWTWHAEKKGAEISCVFYSANEEPLLNGVPNHEEPLLQYCTWPNLIVFNKLFENSAKNRVKYETAVQSFSTVFFSDNSKLALPTFKKSRLSIAVFDISPMEPQLMFNINENYDYIYSDKNRLRFYELFYNSIVEIAIKHDADVLIKPKRSSKLFRRDYLDLLTKLSEEKNVNVIPSDISAFRLIDQSDGAIVQPFTSPGYYAESLTPITFYDPLGLIHPGTAQAHGQHICVNSADLNIWFEKLPSKPLKCRGERNVV